MTRATARSRGAEWSASHFLIEGRYCPASEILRSVDSWRAARSLEWAVLMPFPTGGATMFGSLMHVTHERRATAGPVQDAVTSATTPDTARELGAVLAQVADRRGPRGESSAVTDTERRVVLGSPILDALTPLWDECPPLGLWRPGSWFPKGGARYFVLAPDGRARATSAGLCVMRDDRLAELEPALHATHQVALHLHEGRQQRPVRTDAEPGRRQSPMCLADLRPAESVSHFGPAHEYEDLLERSPIISQADLAALYLVDRAGRRLTLVASVGTKRAPASVAMKPDQTTLAFVVDRDRPRVSNHAKREPRLHSTIELGWLGNTPAPADFSEIVVPVSSMARKHAVIGALVVQKRARTDEDVFDIHDLNQLELLSSRVSLRRSNLLFYEVTERLSEMTGHNMLASSGSVDPAAVDPPWQELPADMVAARQSLERAVDLAHMYTPALSTVLYLLDRQQRRLLPAVSAGAPLFTEPIEISQAEHKVQGLAPTVLTFGDPILIDDRLEPQALRSHRGRISREHWPPGIRTALALPITILDRTVGVLVIVGERAGTLEPSQSFSHAVGHQISAALLLAQRAEEQRAFLFASSTALHAHEILKRVDRLREFGDEVSDIAEQIKRHVDSLHDLDPGDGLPALDPVAIVKRALERAGLTEFAVWEKELAMPPVSPSVAIALERAAYEVFTNAKAWLVSDGRTTRVQLRMRLKRLGGLPRLVLESQHCVRRPIPPAVEAKIYRTPIEDSHDRDSRRHFGAFTAGYWMRAVGGDVYIWRNEREPSGRTYVATVIEMPVLTLAPKGRED